LVAALNEDPTNREKWDRVITQLELMGLDISSGIGESIYNFVEETKGNIEAMYSDTYLKNMGVSDTLISQYKDASPEAIEKFHKTFEKWKKDYDTANDETAQTEHHLITKIVSALTAGYEKQNDALQSTAEAVAEANESMVSAISSKIDENRQARENEKTEKEIADKYSKMAYLSMDTSGSNALAMIELEQEIAEAEQNYQDTLIDQTIAEMEDANARAEEQRERQIELARQQLNAYTNSDEILT
jgi:hypothetical protein